MTECAGERVQILEGTIEEICRRLCKESDKGQRIRLNSLFVGVLTTQEV